jgi:hypothetical protein
LVDLVRTAAPWARRFPTVRELDEETGAFLTRPHQLVAAEEALRTARSVELIRNRDAALLEGLLSSYSRGDGVSKKAGTRGFQSVRNLALAAIFTTYIATVGDEIAADSVAIQKSKQFYLQAEASLVRVFRDASSDVRAAIKATLAELRASHQGGMQEAPSEPATSPAGLPTASADEVRRKAARALGRRLDTTLVHQGGVLFASTDGAVRAVVLVSRFHSDREPYWYGYTPAQADFLANASSGHLVLAGLDGEEAFAIPAPIVRGALPSLNETVGPQRTYWHIKLRVRNDEVYLAMPKSLGNIALGRYAVSLR